MKYQRWISYLYQYQGGQKLANTGFVKVEQKGTLLRISVRCKLTEREPDTYGIYLVSRQTDGEGRHYGILLDRIQPVQGMLTYQYVAGKEEPEDRTISMQEYIGVMLRAPQGIYMTVWTEAHVHPEQVLCGQEVGEHPNQEEEMLEALVDWQQEEVMQEAAATDGAAEADREEDVPPAAAAADMHGMAYLFAHRQPLPPVEGGQLTACIRIEPKDLGLLSMANWKYGTNSFLSHGYYKYRYLLLGKLQFQDDSEKLLLGVPSIYTNREKNLANLFGFEQFVTAKRTDRKLGQFGYWIVELAP